MGCKSPRFLVFFYKKTKNLKSPNLRFLMFLEKS